MRVQPTTYHLSMYYKPLLILHEAVIDVPDLGWRFEPVQPMFSASGEQLRVMLTKHSKDPQQRYLAFQIVKTGELPCLDGSKIMEAILPSLIQVVNDLSEATPMHGEHDYELPKIEYVQFRHAGLPGELLPLRNQIYRAIYE